MLTINLFDETFRHATISTAFQESQHVQYVRDRMEWSGITVFVDGYINSPIVSQVRSDVKLGWLHEPQCLYPQVYEQARYHAQNFDAILTYYQPYLNVPGFTFAPYGGVWVPQDYWALHKKTRMTSMLYGSKCATIGHQMRHAIADAIGNYYDVDYYGYKGTPTGYGWLTKVLVHKDYRFSIVVEACREDNLFTEILLDCFATGTIPIFWGCPNIDQFFNADGMLILNRLKDLRYIMPQLSDDLYQELLPYAKENLERVKEYAVCEDWLYEHIFKTYANHH